MKTSSAKGKGRRLQNFVAQSLSDKTYHYGVPRDPYYEFWKPREGDIKPVLMGGSGVDIQLSPIAKDWIPYDIECKNQEKWNIPQWWKQTTANTEEGRKPLLIVGKNRHEPLVVMRFEDWLELII